MTYSTHKCSKRISSRNVECSPIYVYQYIKKTIILNWLTQLNRIQENDSTSHKQQYASWITAIQCLTDQNTMAIRNGPGKNDHKKKKKVELMRCILIIFASSRMLLMMGYYRTAFKNLNTWSNIIDSPLQGQGPFQGQSTLHTRPTSPCAWSHGFCIMTNWFRREQSGVWLNGRSHQLTTDMCMLYKLPYDMCRLG